MDQELDHSVLALIKPYLEKLRHHEVVKVGISLGLDSRKISDVRAEEIHQTMIERWLGKQDYVEKTSGKPTWRTLVKALRDNGYNGVAGSIEERFLSTDASVKSLDGAKAVEPQQPPARSSIAAAKHVDNQQMEFSKEMNPDQLHNYLCANLVPPADCQKIKELSIGGAAFMHFDEEFWKRNQITEVGQFYIGHTKEKIMKSVSQPPASTAANGTHSNRQEQSYSNGSSIVTDNHEAHTAPDSKLSEQDFNWIVEKLHFRAYLWKQIGEGLGFKHSELSCIGANPMNLSGAPGSYLREMLSSWLQWAPGDGRGSKDYATRHALRRAVSSAGLGREAEQL